MDLIIAIICVIACAMSGFILGRVYEQEKHRYVGDLFITRDPVDKQTYISCEFTELNNVDELRSFNTVTLKIQCL